MNKISEVLKSIKKIFINEKNINALDIKLEKLSVSTKNNVQDLQNKISESKKEVKDYASSLLEEASSSTSTVDLGPLTEKINENCVKLIKHEKGISKNDSNIMLLQHQIFDLDDKYYKKQYIDDNFYNHSQADDRFINMYTIGQYLPNNPVENDGRAIDFKGEVKFNNGVTPAFISEVTVASGRKVSLKHYLNRKPLVVVENKNLGNYTATWQHLDDNTILVNNYSSGSNPAMLRFYCY